MYTEGACTAEIKIHATIATTSIKPTVFQKKLVGALWYKPAKIERDRKVVKIAKCGRGRLLKESSINPAENRRDASNVVNKGVRPLDIMSRRAMLDGDNVNAANALTSPRNTSIKVGNAFATQAACFCL